jgi:hypothetical protein
MTIHNERNKRTRVDGRRSTIGSSVGGWIVVVWYQRHAAISPASAAAKFNTVASTTALPVRDIQRTDTGPLMELWPKVGDVVRVVRAFSSPPHRRVRLRLPVWGDRRSSNALLETGS